MCHSCCCCCCYGFYRTGFSSYCLLIDVIFFLPFLMKFFFLVRFCAIRDSFFTVNGMKWSNALCLVFFLLTLKRWCAFFDWIYSVRCLLFDEYDRNGVFENLILWRSVIGWFNNSVYYYSLVRSIGEAKVGLTYLLSCMTQIFFKTQLFTRRWWFLRIEFLLQFWIWFRRFTSNWFVMLCVSYIGYCLYCILFIVCSMW